MALGQRVAQRRKELGLTMEEVANQVGVSQAAINNMEKRDARSSKNVERLAEILGVGVEWLLTGEGLKEISSKIYALPVIPMHWLNGSMTSEVRTPPSLVEMYRIFGKDEIAKWIPVMTDFQDRGFAITVRGDSMVSPSGRSFPDGTDVVFELYPNGKKLQTADLVLARMSSSEEVTFKKYVEEAGHRYLAPLNPQYPIIEGEFTVVAVYQFGIIY